MTNKIIEVDAFNKLIDGLKFHMLDDSVADEIVDFVEMLEKKINELATPAPEPQQSIFDAHAFNLKEESRHSQYWRPNDILISNQDTIIKLSADNFNCHKLRKLRNITAEQRCLYSKICELADRLDEKIQQESIFDAEGWCYDFNKFKDFYSENGFLIKTEYGYTTIKCGEQYRLCLNGVVAWRPLPTLPRGLR